MITNQLLEWFLADTFKHVAYLSVTLYIVYSLSLALYNVYFHPLSKFPGPPMRAAFDLPFLLSLYKGVSVQETKGYHEKYGGVVRINPNALSFNTAQAWKDIYGARGGKKQLPKDEEWFVDHRKPVNIIKSNDDDHARIRKHIAHAFSDVALREQESLLTAHTDQLIRQMYASIQNPTAVGMVNLRNWYNFLTFDVIGDMCLGDSFHTLETGEYHHWIISIFEGLKFWRVLRFGNTYPVIGWIMHFLMTAIPAIAKERDSFFRLPKVRVEKRMREKTDRNDIMAYILRNNDEKGEPMTDSEITETACILIVGGSETTATLLSGATYHVLKHPHVLQKAQDEVRNTFAKEQDINLTTLAKLPYLNAIINESLRIYPPASSIFPRRTEEWEVIDGYQVAPNTSVGVHQYATYHSGKNFANPDAFVPERWLPDAPKEYQNDDRASFQPFHLGPRNCIGRLLTLFEIRSTLARMLWNFDMDLCDDSQDWANQRVFLVWEKPALNVKLTARQFS